MISTMKASIGLVMLLFSTASTDISGECDMAGFYLELGCKPVPSSDTTNTCPQSFECPDLHPDKTMCYYRGLPYSDRSMLPQSQIKNPCSQACSCQVSSEPQLNCAAADCVETFDADMQQMCIKTYELDSCCSVGTVCGKDDVANLKTCEVDGKTYREGEYFEPLKTRKSCICTAKWNGSTDNPEYCRDINCGIEIHYQGEILEKCAPVFATGARSCPISFECPTPTTKVVRALNTRFVSSQCVFGNMTLSVGDEVTVDDKHVKCSCGVPPFVSCNRRSSGR